MSLGQIRLLEDCPTVAVITVKLSNCVLHVVSLLVVALKTSATVIVFCDSFAQKTALVSVAFVIGTGILLINGNSFPDFNSTTVTILDFIFDVKIIAIVWVWCWHIASL
tara:strand:+ start:282 stop:608 length:327 start_codon:yes stop_codon:yes gene_type:complete